MAKQITQYELLISCPGDITDEVKIIEEVVERFNQQFTATLGIGIITRHWSKSAYSQSGSKPQQIINQQFVEDCDAAVAVFWTRFGTPTDEYGSGSEEEIEVMLKSGKQVFMYFCDKQIEPSQIDYKQYNKITEFREKYKDKGLFYCYKTNDEFREMINAHLIKHFITLSQVKSLEKQCPCLALKSIKEGQIIDYAIAEKFELTEFMPKAKRLEEIKKLFEEIATIRIVPSSKNNTVSALLVKKVEIEASVKDYIKVVADALEIVLDPHFFDLGNLCENSSAVPTYLGGWRELIGNVEEKTKYEKILSLKKSIKHELACGSIEECYGDNVGVKFLLANDGNSFDEDIDVELTFDKNIFLSHHSFNVLKKSTFNNLEEYSSLSDIFAIGATDKYMDYLSSCKPFTHVNLPSQPIELDLWNQRNYEEEYFEELAGIFDYEIYDVNDKVIVKVHFDYIKQHNIVAFPTPLFVQNMEDNVLIPYKITSKHNPDVTEGEIEIRLQ